ncbi:hypothetical protein [Neptuniibacter sp. 2_MG-2023]|uniref:hypothetical protein n=1 Tax=Neptuniibacter sp. 2_MG-2023 TaxID=3062671 RepID=UPI0026E406B8|nr:hypothetical protein [Neptuniibacter sp. 2_MG-2023]MDO6513582.1 hypothetical protein [Neptuniibacter sp. 2_MG-2023]
MPRSDKFSLEDTKRLLDHAVSASSNMTATKVAKFIDVPPPRISEGRRKEWRLSQHEADTLIAEYGQPRAKPGLFVSAEGRDSIKSFIELEPSTSKMRHFKKVSSLHHSSQFLNSVAQKIAIIGEDDKIITAYEEFSEEGDELLNLEEQSKARKARAQKKHSSAEFRKQKLDILLAVMQTPKFSKWLKEARLYFDKLRKQFDDPEKVYFSMGATGYYGINEIQNLTPNGDNEHLSSEGSLHKLLEEYGLKPSLYFNETSLLLFGTLEQLFRELESSNTNKSLISENENTLMEIKDYVITGEKIWSHEGRFTEPKLGLPGIEEIFFPDIENRPDWTYPLLLSNNRLKSPDEKDENSLSVDRWTTYEISLFLKDNCDYALLLSLGSYENRYNDVIHHPERFIIIPNIPGLQLFKELDEMRKWLTLPELPLNNIKKDIAKHGGYIPGAIVI